MMNNSPEIPVSSPLENLIFSVVVPCYNQAHYLPQAVASILHQSYSKWQLIIVNDGSTDKTNEVAEFWASQDDRIEVIHQINAGLPAARNAGIGRAKGKWICFLDADDCLLPDFMQQMATQLQGHIEVAVSGYVYFNDTGTLYKEVLVDAKPQEILHKNIAPPVAFAMQKVALQKTGLFDEGYHTAEDWDLWIRCYKAGLKWSIVPHVLVKYRVVPNSMSRNAAKMYQGFVKAAQQALAFDPRIKLAGPYNRDYTELTSATAVQQSLAICLGLLVIQGKHQEAVAMFKQETDKWGLVWQEQDFSPMCSFLSFRYQTSKAELKRAVEVYKPAFEQFLQTTGLPEHTRNAALQLIIGRHQRIYTRAKWGPLAAVLQRMNWI